jgi:hypothetical protein
VHVAAYIEVLQRRLAAPSVKQHLAAIRMLFDWLVVGQVIAVNPASPVRGPKYSVKKGKTAVLSAEEARKLLDSIDPSSHVGLRDRALIALMVYTFARIGAALKMKVEDVYTQKRRTWVRLHEKGGKRHEMPCHHNLDAYLHAYIDGAGIGGNPKNILFPTALGRTGLLSEPPDEPGRRLSHDPPPASKLELRRRSEIIPSARPALLNICATAVGARSHSRWRTTSQPGQPGSMIGAMMRFRSMRWSGS